MNYKIVITKKNRDEQFNTCLYYLNKSNADKKHNLKVFIAGDCKEVDANNYPNLDIINSANSIPIRS